MLLESYEGLRGNTGATSVHIETARMYLEELYTAWDRPEEASRYAEEP